MATLTIDFDESVVPPTFGYRIKYWDVTTPTIINTTTVTASPAEITDLTGLSYAGTVEALCTSGGSSPQSFTAAAPAGPTTAKLSFVDYSCNNVAFQLNKALTASFTINSFSINGFKNTTCLSIPAPSVDILQTPIVNVANNTFMVGDMIGFTCDTLMYRPIPSIKINGVVIQNNGTFTTGGTIVTVSLPTICKPYSCSCS